MLSGNGDPALLAKLVPLIADRIADRPEPSAALRIDDWWAHLAADLPLVSSHGAAGQLFECVVSVDALRTAPNPVSCIRPDGRLYFVEVVEVHGRSAPKSVSPFDVSGHIWSRGFSVIDIDRPRLAGPGGSWEFAIGIARPTPTQQNPAP